MFTSAEAQELRAYYTRYPFDDESNVWLPHGLLMAKISGLAGSQNAEQKTVRDFMPFVPADDEPVPLSEPKPYTKKQLKRIQKYKGW